MFLMAGVLEQKRLSRPVMTLHSFLPRAKTMYPVCISHTMGQSVHNRIEVPTTTATAGHRSSRPDEGGRIKCTHCTILYKQACHVHMCRVGENYSAGFSVRKNYSAFFFVRFCSRANGHSVVHNFAVDISTHRSIIGADSSA